MNKQLTNDICTMVDALMANDVLGYGRSYLYGTDQPIVKYIQVANVNDVRKYGEKFQIIYERPQYIEFSTQCGDFNVMCLLTYPEYEEWMNEHPNTEVIDQTHGKE